VVVSVDVIVDGDGDGDVAVGGSDHRHNPVRPAASARLRDLELAARRN